ncbi:MAG TPA: GNAT family N-acetyltransferase [Stellaceae bacterium]|nr:GNAT family N-acetyltransferase [Stellaceae bacterium]
MEFADDVWTIWRRFAEFTVMELYEALRLRQAAFVVEQASPYPDLDGLDQRASHLLLRIEDGLAGYLRLIPYPDEHRAAIGRVAVAPPFRRRGLARLMMEGALASCRRDHPDWAVTLDAQSYLVPFYESLGFRSVSPPYDDYGVPHVAMRLEER